jgi:hypothetical protein
MVVVVVRATAASEQAALLRATAMPPRCSETGALAAQVDVTALFILLVCVVQVWSFEISGQRSYLLFVYVFFANFADWRFDFGPMGRLFSSLNFYSPPDVQRRRHVDRDVWLTGRRAWRAPRR